jgi:hypothetical protein
MKKTLLAGIAALFLATGTAHASIQYWCASIELKGAPGQQEGRRPK